jgi:probable F420-dependent oxidoreductase
MRYGIEVVNLGDLADPRPVLRLARAAESAGWEMLVLWDHLAFVWSVASGAPWITLAGVAAVTERLRLGTGVSPLPRYRPHLLAHELATLDQLSDGRVTLGVGLGGVEQEFAAFGEPTDARHRASLLDECLEVITGMWSGERLNHHGAHFHVDRVQLEPLPVQRPRIPIWVGGESPPALRRAARWDGWIVAGVEEQGGMSRTPEQMGRSVEYLRARRSSELPSLEVAITGYSAKDDAALVREYAHAGVTWWLESLHLRRGSERQLLARIADGPPG